MSDFDRHEHWSEDLAAYLLGALTPDEATGLERHLEGCDRCRDELRWLDPAVRALPESVDRQEPPRALRESLMAEVRADARRADQESGANERRRWAPERMRSRGSGSFGLRLAAGIATVALAVAAVAGYEIGKGGSSGEGSGGTITVGKAPGVTAEMVRQGDGGTLQLANVHELPSDKVLEAWVRREGKVEAVPALFVPNRYGRASTTIADMTGVDTVMVTEEPKGGSKVPTSQPLVTLSVQQ